MYMNNKFFALLILATLFAGPSAGFAETAVSASVKADVAVFDGDLSDDEIVQLNNLIIRDISSATFPTVITASHEVGIRCLKYKNETSAGGVAFPCPVPHSSVYMIKVDAGTILMLKNRTRAQVADFVAGDHINVYGFMDRDTNAISALIVRNLDKPAGRKYLQINNIEVAVAPGSTSPASMIVFQKYITPCLDYGEREFGGLPFPCPRGIEVKELGMKIGVGKAAENDISTSAIAVTQGYFPLPRKYEVRITANTKIMDRNRIALPISSIETGDTLNIYGYYTTGSSVMNAVVIRDLSKPVAEQRAVLRVGVSAGNIVCITTPCGILYNATVEIYGENGVLVAKKTTAQGSAVFENLKTGTYTIAASAPGYERNKLSGIVVNPREIKSVDISLTPLSTGTVSVKVLDSLNGIVGMPYSATFEALGGSGTYTFAVTEGSLPPGLELAHPPLPMIACRVEVPCPTTFLQTRIWLSGTPSREGTYKFVLTATDSAGARGKEIFVAVIRDEAPHKLSYSAWTNKSVYASDEKIEITVGVKNNSAEAKTLRFNSGCQAAYAIQPMFDSRNNQACTLALTSVTIPAGGMYEWKMTHSPDIYKLKPGAYKIEGFVLGHGSAATPVVISEISGGTTVPPPVGAIKVITPNGGETWTTGEMRNIVWSYPDMTMGPMARMIDIYARSYIACLDENTGGPRCLIAEPMPIIVAEGVPNTGSYLWKIPARLSGQYKISINDSKITDISDASDKPFIIRQQPALGSATLTSPNGGEAWKMGERRTIRWVSTFPTFSDATAVLTLVPENPSPATIDSSGGGTVSTGIALPSALANIGKAPVYAGTFEWAIPSGLPNGQYRVDISIAQTGRVTVQDFSNAPFTISSSASAEAAQ